MNILFEKISLLIVFVLVACPSFAFSADITSKNLKLRNSPRSDLTYAPVTKSEIQLKTLPMFYEVRSRKGHMGTNIHGSPSHRAELVYRANPGDILQVDITPYSLAEIERWEDQDTGGWTKFSAQTFKNESIPAHLYFNWRDLIQLHKSSRGIPLKPSKILTLPIIPISSDLPRDTLVDCTRKNMLCMNWAPENVSLHLIESRLIQVKAVAQEAKLQWKLAYRVYILEKGDAGDIWYEGWVFSDYLRRNLEPGALTASYCLSSELLLNRAAETEQFLFDAGIMKRPKIKHQKVGSSFFALKKGDPTGSEFDEGIQEPVYNRWLDKMKRENAELVEGGEVAYLFRLRPIFELHAGISYLDYKQEGDSGPLEFSGFGPEVAGTLVFPLFLDFELQVTGEFIAPILKESTPNEDIYLVDVTNDLFWAIPSSTKKINYFIGPGMTFRSTFGPSGDLGFPSLFGLHLSGGFYSPGYFGFAFAGVVARDFNADISNFEWGLYGGKSWYSDDGLRWGIGTRLTGFGFEYTTEEVLSTINTITTTDKFEVLRLSITGFIEW